MGGDAKEIWNFASFVDEPLKRYAQRLVGANRVPGVETLDARLATFIVRHVAHEEKWLRLRVQRADGERERDDRGNHRHAKPTDAERMQAAEGDAARIVG